MAKYRKKSAAIEAIQVTDANLIGLLNMQTKGERSLTVLCKTVNGEAVTNEVHSVIIEDREGAMTARPGDWIITGENGAHYICKDDTFEKTHELVE